MKTKFLSAAAGLVLFAAISQNQPASASTVVFSLSPNTGVSANQPESPLDLGMNFTVNSGVIVDSLGAFTNGSTLVTVALYDITTSTLIATTNVGLPIGSSNYAFNTFGPPVTLAAGLYQINAVYSTQSNKDFNPFEPGGNAASVVFNSLGGALTFVGDYYNYPGFGGLATTFDALSTNGYGAGTFTASVVPLPSTWIMLIAGVLGLGFLAYRGTKKGSDALAAA
jgi:hypothetical protein